VIVAPWVAYNLQRFDHRVVISSQGGRTLSASNCDTTYYGPLLGYKSLFHPGCNRLAEISGTAIPIGDVSGQDAQLRRLATRYIRSHRGRLPVVVLAREGRTWGVFRPFQQLRLDLMEGNIGFLWLEYFCYLAMVPAAIVGVVILRRRRAPLWPMLALILMVAITVASTFGSTRYRAPADVAIALLVAVTIDAAVRAGSGRRTHAIEVHDADSRPPVPTQVP
jgi:hypothetical protein